jgi:major capsid protein E
MATAYDLMDQAVLTDIVNRPLQTQREDQAFLGERIAPQKEIQSRVAKLRVHDVKAFGTGQFKAPGATPPLVQFETTWREEIIELALLEEMHRIQDEDWLKLDSSDETVARAAGMSLVDRGRALRLRNARLAEWMRWQAFRGGLTITYPTGSTLFVDYGIPAANKPTAGVLWSDVATSDPTADIQTWSEQLAAVTGHYGVHAHMTSKTYDYLVRNAKIKAAINYYSPTAPNLQRPRRSDILELFTSFAANVDIVIYDNGYRAEGVQGQGWPGSITKYLPDTHILMTTEYSIDGQNIADTLDGQVLVGADYNALSIRQGPQAEVMVDHMSKTHFMRYASAKIPRLIEPSAFLWAKIA